MAADHRRILATAIGRLRGKIKYRPVVFELMPPAFTLLQVQRTVEALSGVRLHKQNFRRLVAQQGLVEETGGISAGTGGRPARLVRFRPEVVLMDIGLPGMDGYEVARRLREDADLAAGIILLAAVTGYAEDEARRRSREAGFDHHLVKPIDPDGVLALLASLEWARPASIDTSTVSPAQVNHLL